MKKIAILICVLMLGKAAISADIQVTNIQDKKPTSVILTGNLVFDWLDIAQIDRDTAIEKYKSEIFGNDTVFKYNKKEFKRNLLISYAVQYKNNLRSVYYYDALGNLRYVDKFSENYPNFPYMSKQYRANGVLVSAIYFMSHDMQYMYNHNAEFQGAWYKDKMYDRHAKQILTRTNW